MFTAVRRRKDGEAEGVQSNSLVKILLVEDNPGDVELMKIHLEEFRNNDFSLLSVERLQKAIEIASAESPDVILLDLGLPDSSGLATVEGLIKVAGPAPIIVLTGLADERLGMEAVRLGAQDYLIKGKVNSHDLERAIRYSIQRRRSLEDLKESNQRYHSLFKDNHAVMIMIDPLTGNITDVNEAAMEFYGYARDSFTSLNITDITALPAEKVFEHLGRAASKDQQHTFLQHRLSDGSLRDVEVFSGPICVHGRVHLYSIIHDITERKQAEVERERLTLELAQQHDLLQAVIEHATFGIVVLNGSDFIIKLTNDAAINLLEGQMNSIKLIGKSLRDLPLMQDHEGREIFNIVEGVTKFDRPIVKKELEFTEQIGRDLAFWQVAAMPLPGPAEHKDVLLMIQDMTEQVMARQRIEELAARADAERRRLKAILDNLPVGVSVADRAGKVLEKSEITDVIWGGRTPAINSTNDYRNFKGWWADTGIAVRPEEWALVRAVKSGETSVGDVIDILRFDGTRGTIISSAAPIRDGKGSIIGGVGVVQDITRQRKLEHDAIEAKEQAKLYIDLLSHDISNMNASISSNLQMALEKMDIEARYRQYFTKSLDIIATSNRLIENVRKVQRVENHEAKHGMIDLGWLLEDVRTEMEKCPDREVKINYVPTIKKFVVASELLKDVFDNIVGNAIKHSNGKVEISLILNKMFENGREYYKVMVEDDGPGIPDEMKSKLFQRKQKGRSKTAGCGLGLFLVKKLVEDFNGRVWVEDRVPGDHTKGSRFVVMLPVASAEGRTLT